MVVDSKAILQLDRQSTLGQMNPQRPSKSTLPEISGGVCPKRE